MSCRRFEKWIALYIEGDLAPRKSHRLEEHLDSCENCRGFLRGLEQSQAALKSLADETLPASVLQKVRQAVQERIDEETKVPRFHPGWGWALAGTIAVLVLGFVAFLQTGTETPESERVADAPRVEATSTAPPAAEPSIPIEVERPPEPKPVPSIAKHIREDMVVKIMTDNPDIVIYWLVEQNGG